MALPAIKFTLNTARNFDPTRTLVLRGQFVAQVNKRFRALKGAINQLLTKDNFLDPVKPTEYQSGVIPIALAAKYEYMRSDVKVDQFMEWLKDQEGQGILEIIQRPGGLRRGQSQAWSDTYIRSSYSKGIAQGRADLRKLGADIPSFEQIPGGISSVFNQPFHADRVALCYTRCFNGMKGVTEAMNGYLSRELALGMAGGQSPYAIARRINERVDKIGIVRGRLIARTEIIQSHNEAALNEYERAEIEIGETVKVEWVATMDNRVRPHHAERDGKIYERSVAREMLGEPNCRCGLAPYVERLDKKLLKAPVTMTAFKKLPAYYLPKQKKQRKQKE
jgi:SPP1 gp7 family putative phage head morphogenesis protein